VSVSFFFLVQMRVRETSGIEGEAKKEIRDIYTYSININIYFCTFYLEENRHLDNRDACD